MPVRALATSWRLGEAAGSCAGFRIGTGAGVGSRSTFLGVGAALAGLAAAAVAAAARPLRSVRLSPSNGSGSSFFDVGAALAALAAAAVAAAERPLRSVRLSPSNGSGSFAFVAFGAGSTEEGRGVGSCCSGAGSGDAAGRDATAASGAACDWAAKPADIGVERRPMATDSPLCGVGRDADAGGGGTADSPVSSDMPNRSSAASRLASPAAGAAGGGFGPAGARAARFFSLTAEFASAPDFRTANTVLHALQRTRTPRSDTFSSATRNREWQLGHWTTTTHCRRRYRP